MKAFHLSIQFVAVIICSFVSGYIPHGGHAPLQKSQPSSFFTLRRRCSYDHHLTKRRNRLKLHERQSDSSLKVQLNLTLTDEKIRALYAWILPAFEGDARYSNLMYAMAAVFGNLPDDAPLRRLLQQAVDQLDSDETMLRGAPFSQYERESASLGAMGAAQWTGQWQTRPHALLVLSDQWTSIGDWERTLARGCRRTLQRAVAAEQTNYTVHSQPIRPHQPAPHSTFQHFRCVVQHEVRLLSTMYGLESQEEDVSLFFDSLGEAISRYMGTTRMTGLIREYRDRTTGDVLAFAHEVRKGRTVRGQWFYATDAASQQYVWFHSVRSLIERALEDRDEIACVDLGPSGSDDFSVLKAKYGFESVDDWPAVADYHGPFWDYAQNQPVKNGVKW
jgi:hypothetical protein